MCVGRSNNPLNLWKVHLKGLARGQGLYKEWCTLLLDDAGLFKYKVGLFIVADSVLSHPPICEFITDAYPSTLLNLEGNRR